MAQEEGRTLGYLISSTVALLLYLGYVIQQLQSGALDSMTITRNWGVAVLVVIGLQIVLSIVTAIVVSIVEAVRAGEEQPELTDERDKLIELRANRLAYAVFGIGFVIAMVTLALGQPPLLMFNIIVFSLLVAGIAGYVRQLYLYRRGF